jgi:hypothetical protein
MCGEKLEQRFGFALGGLAGNNAHGAGLLQASIDCDMHPKMIACTSGQIHWVFNYLQARINGGRDLETELSEDIKKTAPSGNANIDMALLALSGREDMLRLTLLNEYPVDVLKNSLAATIDLLRQGWNANYMKELLKVWPARTLKPLRDQSFFENVSETFNNSDIGIAFNSYDTNKGIEVVNMIDFAKDLLG